MNPAKDKCPCGSGRFFGQCCGPWHAGLPAGDAEALMRSRYAAFVLCDANYLLATWHRSHRPPHVTFDPRQSWLGLKVLEARVLSDTDAEVEFLARSRIGGSRVEHHERSRFVREEGRWYYLDGKVY